MYRQAAIQEFRTRLVERRAMIRASLRDDICALGGTLVECGDVVDFATCSAQDDFTSAMLEVEGEELEQIDEALQRCDVGGFGDCEECAIEIPLARIKALPFAKLCISCQKKLEKSERQLFSFA